MIKGFVQGQTLKLAQTRVVADTIDYLIAKFAFQGEDWRGLDKWMHLKKEEETYAVRLSGDKTKKEDHLNLGAGTWSLWLHGSEQVDGQIITRITTNVCTFRVEASGTLTGDVFPELPASVGEQLGARMDALESKVDEVQALPEVSATDNGRVLTAVDGEWLPRESPSGEAPTFDLIALGMQTIGVDAGFVGISCDTTEMRAALDKGAVQFKVKLGELSGEGEYEATILMGSIETETDGSKFTCSCRVSGSYVSGGELSTSDVAELTIVVIEGGVMAVMSHLLHVPPVDETSNGKFLQVVDGEWKTADAPSGGGTDIVVDDALSDTSENPVQNKVITQVVQEAGAAIAVLGERVPPVDETSNGKILQVVGGKWQAADAPSGGAGDGSGLPEAEQDGMMLQMVNGAWTAVAVADSSIKTYIDDYINEALGGDY